MAAGAQPPFTDPLLPAAALPVLQKGRTKCLSTFLSRRCLSFLSIVPITGECRPILLSGHTVLYRSLAKMFKTQCMCGGEVS